MRWSTAAARSWRVRARERVVGRAGMRAGGARAEHIRAIAGLSRVGDLPTDPCGHSRHRGKSGVIWSALPVTAADAGRSEARQRYVTCTPRYSIRVPGRGPRKFSDVNPVLFATRANCARSRPTLAGIRSKWGRNRMNSGNLPRLGTSPINIGQFGPHLSTFGTISTDGWPNPARLDQIRPWIDQTWTEFHKLRPNQNGKIPQTSANVGPVSANNSPTSAKLGRDWSGIFPNWRGKVKIGPSSAKIGQAWLGTGQIWPALDQILPDFGRLWATRGGGTTVILEP